jgi:protoporphyrinogen oxidase/ferrochelatase
MTSSRRSGLLVMSYGTPSSPQDIEAYYTHIRRGRPPSPEQLAELQGRYEAIGGLSPLARRTRDQAQAVLVALEQAEPGGWQMALGHKHAPPFVEDAVVELADRGVEHIVGLVLAPHWSQASVGEYHKRATEAAAARDVPYAGVASWHDEPAWLDALADRVRQALVPLPEPTRVLFSAHSLPERVLAEDPYPNQLRESAVAIAERAELDPSGWDLAWQSAGRTPEPWRGPDVNEVIRELATTGQAAGVLVCPQGFVSDHLEVLYDLDIEAARAASEGGLAFARTRSINDEPAVMAALADRVRRLAAAAAAASEPAAESRSPRASGAGSSIDLAVVGGGITGLAAAWEAHRRGAEVLVLEASDRSGGKLRTSSFAGVELDESADAFLARVPEAVQLCGELGIDAELVSPGTGRAYVWVRGQLRALPEGQLLGVPTDLDQVAASGILSADGLARARQDLDAPDDAPDGDESVGALIRRRLGREVVDRLVGPLVGGIWAGDCDNLSLATATPTLAEARSRPNPSLIRSAAELRAAAATDDHRSDRPVFLTPSRGMGRLVEALTAELGDRVRAGEEVTFLEEATGGPGRWRLGPAGIRADAVVLTTPAFVTAPLLQDLCRPVAETLAGIDYSSVVLLALAVPRDGVDRELDGSGFLVPASEGRLLTACSWASSKWPHLAPDPDLVLLRASAGRDGDGRALELGDDELVETLLEDLAVTMRLRAKPVEVRVTRWIHSFPQPRPGHSEHVDRADAALAELAPGLAVAGAWSRGIGIPACIRSGRQAASTLLTRRAAGTT